MRDDLRKTAELEREGRRRAREVGLRDGMTQAEKDRAWDAHYAKHGYPEDLPEHYRK